MTDDDRRRANRVRRLAEELDEENVGPLDDLVLDEIDHALRPPVHERRVPSVGTIVEPRSDPATWGAGTTLSIVERAVERQPLAAARRFADGLSSWLVRRSSGEDSWLVFDRPAGSERDLTVIAAVLDATVVQRHPTGAVRVVGAHGVLRWDGLRWHGEPPVASWLEAMAGRCSHGDVDVLRSLLEFAVHDLGSRGIGALLVYGSGTSVEVGEARLPVPPPLSIRNPLALAPLRHALGQVDGAAVFGADGTLREIGVRLVPSLEAEAEVDGYRGMRHTAGRRYSFDDPQATVIVVSEDGPVSVLRGGEVLGRSPR